VIPIKGLGLPQGHALAAMMSTATTSGSPISGPVGEIHDQGGKGTNSRHRSDGRPSRVWSNRFPGRCLVENDFLARKLGN